MNRKKKLQLIFLLVAALLGGEALEASHFHVGGGGVLECVQCQHDSSTAVVESSSTELLIGYANDLDVLYRWVSTDRRYSRPSPRGPPSIS